MKIEEHPRFTELSNGQQILARKIVNAGIATAEDVVTAFAVRENGKIGRWKQALEREGLASDSPSPGIDPQKQSAARAGVANSPWNMGQATSWV